MVDLGADSQAEPGPEAEPTVGVDEDARSTAPARGAPQHAAPPPGVDGAQGPPTRARLATIAVIGIAVVLIVAFALSAFGGSGGTTAGTGTPSAPATSAAPSSSLTTTETLCLHLRELALLRVDNFTRVAAELADDEAAIQAAGDAKLAAAVARMRLAVLAYRDALAGQGDTTAASQQLAAASNKMPCS